MNFQSIIDNFSACCEKFPVDSIPNNAAIRDGIIVNTGGYDKFGRPILSFPICVHTNIQLSQVSQEDMMDALEFYYSIIRVPDKAAGLSILIDFRATSEILIDSILSSIYKFQKKYPSAVQVLYLIQPKDRKLLNILKQQLVLKKQSFFSKLFRINNHVLTYPGLKNQLLKSTDELKQLIENKYLTSDFGGYLNYDHQCWLQLKEDQNQYVVKIQKFKDLIPETLTKLEDLYKKIDKMKVETDDTDDALEWIKKTFYDIMESIGTEVLFTATDAFLDELTPNISQREKTVYQKLCGNPHMENVRYFVTKVRGKLVELQSHFQNYLHNAEEKLFNICRFKDIQEIGGEALRWIQEVGLPKMNESVVIAADLDEAETVARYYHNEIFTEGMKNIEKCEDVVQKLKNSTGDDSELKFDKSIYIEKINKIVNLFREKLQNRRKLYSDIYQFYLTFSQLSRWLTRTLKFLPDHLLQYHQDMKSDEIFVFGSGWNSSMRQYLLKHPSPKPAHLYLLDKMIPQMTNVSVRNEARLLYYKLKVILKLCASAETSVKEVREAIEWKNRINLQKKINKMKLDKTEEKDIKLCKSEPDIMRAMTSDDLDKSMKLNETNIDAESENHIRVEKLNMVDLADSERQSKAQSESRYSMKPSTEEKLHNQKYANKRLREVKTNHHTMQSHKVRSQPDINLEFHFDKKYSNKGRGKDLINLAEKTVRESLKNVELIRGKDLLQSFRKNEEDELSLILNQLMYDISSPQNKFDTFSSFESNSHIYSASYKALK